MSTPPIQLEACERRFGERVALCDANLTLERGEIVGLAGPNGSGKTTLLRLLSGFLRPTSGSVRVFGMTPYSDQPRVMRRASFVFAPPALYGNLTAREHLLHLSAIRTADMPRVERREIDEALEQVGLLDRAGDRVRTFSFGMRQRLALALALVPVPELLVLDEPTDGLDPLAIGELRELLLRLRDERGATILFSSHLLSEVERLADRTWILSEGKTLFQGSPRELLDETESTRLRADDSVKAKRILEERGVRVRRVGEELEVRGTSLNEVRGFLGEEGVELLEYWNRRPSLEDALLARLEESEA